MTAGPPDVRSVLDGGDDFLLFRHRCGNSRESLARVARENGADPPVRAGRRVRLGVEGDLKWLVADGRIVFYFWHGRTGIGMLRSEGAVRRRVDEGRCLPLSELDHRRGTYYLLDVKGGVHADGVAAFRELGRQLEDKGIRPYCCIGSSSLAWLEEARAALPDVPTVLFVTWAFGDGRVLHLPKTRVVASVRSGLRPDVSSLACVDAVANTNPAIGDDLAAIDRGARAVEPCGKPFLPGAFRRRDTYLHAVRSGRKAAFCYADPDEWVS